MSEELQNYLNEMNKVYNEATTNIRKQYNENNSISFLDLLLSNNEGIKNYIIQLGIGTNLDNEEDNRIAMKELSKRNTEFTNFVLSF